MLSWVILQNYWVFWLPVLSKIFDQMKFKQMVFSIIFPSLCLITDELKDIFIILMN
jgi:hypothetical protein